MQSFTCFLSNKPYLHSNRPLSSCPKPLFQSEAKYEAIDVKMIFIFTKLESFRFEDEDDYDYEIQPKVFSRILEKYSI